MVEVELDLISRLSLTNLYLEMVEGYAHQNPYAGFWYTEAGVEHSFPAVATRSRKGFRENIHCYTSQDFEHRVEAQIREKPSLSIQGFLGGFQFIAKTRIETSSKVMNDLHNNGTEVRSIYEQLKEKTKPPSHEHLPLIGRKALIQRLIQVSGVLEGTVPGYYRGGGEPTDASNGVVIPYSVEVAAAITNSGFRRLYFSLNGSVKLDEPFSNRLLGRYRGRNIVGLTGLLESKGIIGVDNVVIVVNLICPNIPYEDPGKTKIEVQPFIEEVKKTVLKAAGYIKKSRKGLGLSPSYKGISQKGETLRVLPEAIEKVSSGGKFRYKQRQLWYVVRELLGEMHPK